MLLPQIITNSLMGAVTWPQPLGETMRKLGMVYTTHLWKYPLVMTTSLLLRMAVEMVSFPVKMVIVHSFLYVYQRINPMKSQ